MITLIAAIGKNFELGFKNDLIWKIKEDLKFFKETTIKHTVVMGRKTYDSISKPLPNRKNIVLTKDKNAQINEDVEVYNDPEKILKDYENEDIYIIGGESIYKLFLNKADRIILTEIQESFDKADTHFPNFDKSNFKILKSDFFSENNIKYKRTTYSRKQY